MANIFRAKSLISRTGTFSNEATAPNLVYNTGSQDISGLKAFELRPTVNGTGVLLSGEAASLPTTIVYTTGDQIISGNKTFVNNIEVQGTGTFTNLDLSNISSFSFSGVTIDLINSIINSSGQILISGNPVLTGVLDSAWASQNELNSLTGSLNLSGIRLENRVNSLSGTLNISGNNLESKINSLSGSLGTTSTNLTNTINSLSGSLNTSGNNLESEINSLSGFVSNISTNLNNTISSLTGSLNSSGNILESEINSLSGSLNLSGDNLESKINSLSGSLNISGNNLNDSINSLSGSVVLLTGNQTVNGLKDFTTRPTVNTVPVLLSGEATDGLHVLVKNDDSITLKKGQPVYIYGANGANILVRAASNSGDNTSSKTLGLLNQDLAPNDQGFVTTEGDLNNVDTSLAGSVGDAIWLGPTGNLIFGLANKPYAPNHLVYLGVVERKHENVGKIYVKIQNGFELEELHNVNINHSYALNNNDIIRYNSASGIWFNQSLDTGIFQDQINSLSGSVVLLTGNQNIDGTKYFRNTVYIHDLYVTGEEFIANVTNNFIESPYLLLNLTGGAIDGGIFFVTGSGTTGINDYGPIIGFDHTSSFKFGIARRSDDLAILNDIGSVQQINSLSGSLNLTGLRSLDYISSLSGSLDSSGLRLLAVSDSLSGSLDQSGLRFLNFINSLSGTLNISGNNIESEINSLSGNVVFLTGNQNISDTKIFLNNQIFSGNIGVSGTGIFNAIDLNNIDNLVLSGIDITITGNSIINSQSNILILGNPVLTGQSANMLNILSGVLNATGLRLLATDASLSGSLNNSGLRLLAFDSSLSGSLNASGLRLLASDESLSGSLNATGLRLLAFDTSLSGSLNLSGDRLESEINSLSGASVLIYGNQNIGGNKTFTGVVTFSGQEVNLVDTALNLSGVGNMTFSGTNINFINSPVFISGTDLRVSGDIFSNNLYTTGNIGVGTNAPSEKLEVNGNIKFGDSINGYSAKFLMYDSPNGVYSTGEWYDGQLILSAGGYATNKFITLNFQGDTNLIESNGSMLKLPSGKNDFIAMDAEVVHKTGNEIISGDKIFIDDINVSGTGTFAGLNLDNINNLLLSGMTINISGNSIVDIFNPVRISGNQVLTGVTQDSRAVLTTTNQTIAGIKTFSTEIVTNLIDGADTNFTNALPLIISGGNAVYPYTTGGNIDIVGGAGGAAAGVINLRSNTNINGNLNITGNIYLSGNPVLTGIPDGGWASQTELDSLSGNVVLLTGNQTISGNKTFVNSVEIIAPVSGMYGTGDLLNALNVRGFASVSTDLSSLTGIFNPSGVGLSGVSPGQFSVGNMLIGADEGGAYIGRVGITENSWQILSGTEGLTWTARESNRSWFAIAMSSDGRIQTAVADTNKIYTSYDYGVTWIARESDRLWQSVAMSLDGKVQTAVVYDGQIYTSYDYGVTWIPKQNNRSWYDIAMSSDGRIQAGVVTDNKIYISYDYGVTWTARENNRAWISIEMSSDGRIQTAVTNGNKIYTSYDYGATWTARESNRAWYGIAMSSDGRIQTAVVNADKIYTSYDYGVTWTARESNRNWFAIAMSSDGRIQTAVAETDKIYTSYDYGATWTARESNRAWYGIAMSSDGRIQTTVANSNNIYTSYATTITPNPINVLGSVTANNLVYNTGNQIISGVKTFANDINVSGTGTLGGLNLENINNLLLSGMNINITGNSIVNVFNPIRISGNEVVTQRTTIFGQTIPIDAISGYSSLNLVATDNPFVYLGNNVRLKAGQGIIGGNIILEDGGVGGAVCTEGNGVIINRSGSNNYIFTVRKSGAADSIRATNTSVNINNLLTVSGNPVLTGVDLSNYVTKSLAIAYGIAL